MNTRLQKYLDDLESFDDDDLIRRCAESMDESYPIDGEFGGHLDGLSVSEIVREMSPNQFDSYFADWLDSECRGIDGLLEVGGVYYKHRDVLAAQDDAVSEVEAFITELEEELEIFEEEDRPENAEVCRANIALLRAEIDEIKSDI